MVLPKIHLGVSSNGDGRLWRDSDLIAEGGGVTKVTLGILGARVSLLLLANLDMSSFSCQYFSI